VVSYEQMMNMILVLRKIEEEDPDASIHDSRFQIAKWWFARTADAFAHEANGSSQSGKTLTEDLLATTRKSLEEFTRSRSQGHGGGYGGGGGRRGGGYGGGGGRRY